MLPVIKVVRPSVLTGQTNGRLPDSLLWSTPGQAGGPTVRLVEPAARGWRALCAAALAAGHTLKATSYGDSYRRYELQYRTFTTRYEPDPFPGFIGSRYWPDHRDLQGNFVAGRTWYQKPGTAVAAVPGTSQHGWGLAVDTGEEIDGDAGTESLDDATLAWLVANEQRFGWSHEVQSEKWHIHYFAGDAIPQAVLDYEEAQMGLEEWTAKTPDPTKLWALTQGNPNYAGQQRDTALAFAWEAADHARDAAQAAVTLGKANEAKLNQILALLLQAGGQPPSGPVDLSNDALAEVRKVVDEELDEQSRAGADVDQ